MTHICVGNLTTIGSANGLSPGRRQDITWTNDGILSIAPLGTNFSEVLIGISRFVFMKMRLKVSSAKWRPFCLGPNVLTPPPSPDTHPQKADKCNYSHVHYRYLDNLFSWIYWTYHEWYSVCHKTIAMSKFLRNAILIVIYVFSKSKLNALLLYPTMLNTFVGLAGIYNWY